MMKNLIFFIFLSSFAGCSDSVGQEELQNLKDELAIAKTTIETLKSQIELEGQFVHVVFFKLKKEADPDALISEIKKLEAIKEVKDLEVGTFEDVGDVRALSDYNIMMEMSFDDIEGYKIYQAHPIHLALKESAKMMLAAPPATFDFMKK